VPFQPLLLKALCRVDLACTLACNALPNILRTSHAAAESFSLARSEREAKFRSHDGDSAAVSGRFNCQTGAQVNPYARTTRLRELARLSVRSD
jgi:hypothetical protein